MSGLTIGDRVRVVGNTRIKHHYKIGDIVKVTDIWTEGVSYGVQGYGRKDPFQIIREEDLESIEEQDTMAHNNGDLIKVATDKDQYGSPQYTLFVKFGEFYYDLSKGGQMRGAKNIPKPARGMPKNEKIGNMSGTGDYMLGAKPDMAGDSKPPEVGDDDCPFDEDSEIEGLLGPTAKPLTATDVEELTRKFREEEDRIKNEESLRKLEAFKKGMNSSGFDFY